MYAPIGLRPLPPHVGEEMKRTVEIVCCSLQDCIDSARAGAGRIELCAAIEQGGLTPSIGLLQRAKQSVPIPIMAMIRPRGSGFCYSDWEFETMLADIAAMQAADGFVFGVLTPRRVVDVERCAELVKAAGTKQKVFHRAFDRLLDPLAGLESLIDLGFNRILTSGIAPTAEDGIETLEILIKNAAGRIEIMPGGGIRPENVEAILETKCKSVHLAPMRELQDPSTPGSYRAVDRAAVESVVMKCNSGMEA